MFANWETVGSLLHEGLIDLRIFARGFGGFYRGEWERWGPMIKQYREFNHQPRAWIEAEYLYVRLMEFGRANPEYGIV